MEALDIFKAIKDSYASKYNLCMLDMNILINNACGVGDHSNIMEDITSKIEELESYNSKIEFLNNLIYEEKEKGQ